MGGGHRFFWTNIFLFCRVFYFRDRCRALPWLSFERQFPISLCSDWLLRFLATLAHFAFHLPARLPLFSARWQPGWMGPRRNQSGDRHVPRRSLAWRGLDLCSLGA